MVEVQECKYSPMWILDTNGKKGCVTSVLARDTDVKSFASCVKFLVSHLTSLSDVRHVRERVRVREERSQTRMRQREKFKKILMIINIGRYIPLYLFY